MNPSEPNDVSEPNEFDEDDDLPSCHEEKTTSELQAEKYDSISL